MRRDSDEIVGNEIYYILELAYNPPLHYFSSLFPLLHFSSLFLPASFFAFSRFAIHNSPKIFQMKCTHSRIFSSNKSVINQRGAGPRGCGWRGLSNTLFNSFGNSLYIFIFFLDIFCSFSWYRSHSFESEFLVSFTSSASGLWCVPSPTAPTGSYWMCFTFSSQINNECNFAANLFQLQIDEMQ